jgi:hypothetical protein
MNTAPGALLGPTPTRRMFIVERRSSRADIRPIMKDIGPTLARYGGLYRHRGCDGASNTDGDVSRHDVLILSADPLAAALLGAAVELAGHVPHFPQPGEGARAALRRLRPRAALIDCDHDEACAESFIGPALMTGAKVQLFYSRRTRRDASDVARRLGLSIAELPMEPDALASLLHELPGTTT